MPDARTHRAYMTPEQRRADVLDAPPRKYGKIDDGAGYVLNVLGLVNQRGKFLVRLALELGPLDRVVHVDFAPEQLGAALNLIEVAVREELRLKSESTR